MTLAWPKGVIARCLAPGGATADVIHVAEDNQYEGTSHSVSGECTGELCNASHQGSRYTYPKGSNPLEDDEDFQYAINIAREWAKNHSKTCRWVPKPCS